jgi:hypothetical protein
MACKAFAHQVRVAFRMIIRESANGLRCVYYSPADTKDEGFIETDPCGPPGGGTHPPRLGMRTRHENPIQRRQQPICAFAA